MCVCACACVCVCVCVFIHACMSVFQCGLGSCHFQKSFTKIMAVTGSGRELNVFYEDLSDDWVCPSAISLQIKTLLISVYYYYINFFYYN